MSYLAGSDPRDLWAMAGGAVAIGALMAWWTRREGADPGRVVSHCADGSVIGAWHRGVRRRPARRRPRLALTWRRGDARRGVVREDLEPGDLAFLRVREGRDREAPWIVEGMDSACEAFGIHWEFETPEEAIAAYRLLEERIAEPPQDADGHAIHLSDRDFDALWTDRGFAGASDAPAGAVRAPQP